VEVLVTASIYRRLVAEAERRGAAVDEVAVELLERALGASLDPPERAEFHRSLAEKFLREAEELLARGDYLQASEKAWGAAAQIVKAVAAKAGKELRSHGDLWRFVSEIAGGGQRAEETLAHGELSASELLRGLDAARGR
jgi:hypothetical protein